jgi:hypothetical protein
LFSDWLTRLHRLYHGTGRLKSIINLDAVFPMFLQSRIDKHQFGAKSNRSSFEKS